MRELSRRVVAFAMFGAVGGAGVTARGETPAFQFDASTCFGASSCPCGYVCVTGYCSFRGSSFVPAECGSDSDCRPECGDRVCVDRRCVARTSSVDASAEAPWDSTGAPPPLDRPVSVDRLPPVVDVPLERDTGVTVVDAGTTATDAPAAVEETPPDDPGRLVHGCGCTVAGASPARSWWALGLLAFALRRRSRRAR